MGSKIDFYMNLDYPIILRKISSADGGGWLAEIPDLPGCISDGETQQEALDNVQDAKRDWLEVAIERKQEIPVPNEKYDEYSGKFTLRLPKSFHGQLAKTAKEEGVSLNQYIQTLLAYNFGSKQIFKKIACENYNSIVVKTQTIAIEKDSVSAGERLWKQHGKPYAANKDIGSFSYPYGGN